MKHVPNTLSIIRIFAACAVLVTMLTVPPESKLLFLLVPGLLFVLASITDLIDGYIARKYELVTDFGKFIDPIADKLLTVFAMLGFLQIDADEGKLFMFIAIAATLLREFVVSSLRMYAASAGTVIAAGWSGKLQDDSAGRGPDLIFPVYQDRVSLDRAGAHQPCRRHDAYIGRAVYLRVHESKKAHIINQTLKKRGKTQSPHGVQQRTGAIG